MPELPLEIEIDYDSNGLTTRRVSVCDYEWNAYETAVIIRGYCHLRKEERSFKSTKIKRCINLSDSSIIPDLAVFVKSLEGRSDPALQGRHKKPLSRSQEKSLLRRKFVPDVLYYQFKRRFFFLFDDRCFKCGHQAAWKCIPEEDAYMGGVLIQEQLVMDHHIPFEKGGKFESGNLVSLCKRCNGVKGTNLPSAFYSDYELGRLDDYLVAQDQLFPRGRWYWNYDEWDAFFSSDNSERQRILLREGVNEELARCCLRSQDHHYFCGVTESSGTYGVSWTFSIKLDK
mgnify:CR=1 FL=1